MYIYPSNYLSLPVRVCGKSLVPRDEVGLLPLQLHPLSLEREDIFYMFREGDNCQFVTLKILLILFYISVTYTYIVFIYKITTFSYRV